jgi:hypothetical protein
MLGLLGLFFSVGIDVNIFGVILGEGQVRES